MQHYDYIFAGAGLSSLITVLRLSESGGFANKSILLVDENEKKANDRTWCFWEKPNGTFDRIVSKKWNYALFKAPDFHRLLHLKPYQYKMIRGVDFYDMAFSRISEHKNITFLNARIKGFYESGDNVTVETDTQTISCGKLFSSIYDPKLALSQRDFPVLQQHFIGWRIKSTEAVFDPETATFMDFSIPQNGNTRFMYVLPFSKNEALVEYTLFSKDLLPENEYEDAIRDYIKTLGITDFEILEKERGSIPMTTCKFWKNNTKNIMNIGSAGGWTKASTGFTFRNTDKKSAALAKFLETESDFRKFQKPSRFWLYDLLLLDILSEKNHAGATIFSSLFKNGNLALVLKFLDEETSLSEDFRVILKCPKLLFLSALARRIIG
jgi:lycopene beta-cyclase